MSSEPKNSWDTEGIIPGRPSRSEEWEGQRRTLLQIIRSGIEHGLPYDKVLSIARAWNQQQGNPFEDWDVVGMVNWSWNKYSPSSKDK